MWPFGSDKNYLEVKIYLKADRECMLYGGAPSASVVLLEQEDHEKITSEGMRILAAVFLLIRLLRCQMETRKDTLNLKIFLGTLGAMRKGSSDFIDSIGSWKITIANKNFQVVPFYRVEYSDIEKPKIYTIRLKATNQGDIYPKLKLAFGKEILLAPLSIVAMYVEVLDQISNEAKTFLSIYTQLAFNLVFEENFSLMTEYKLIKILVDDMARLIKHFVREATAKYCTDSLVRANKTIVAHFFTALILANPQEQDNLVQNFVE